VIVYWDHIKGFKLLITLLPFSCSSAATTECFECKSLKSMEECVQFMKKVPCPRETDRCRNMTVQVYVRMLGENVTGFQRGCASHDECVFSRCTGHFGKDYGENDNAYNVCNMNCCTGDFCPEGNVTSTETPVGPNRGARSGCDVIHPMRFHVTASMLLSLIKALLLWAVFLRTKMAEITRCCLQKCGVHVNFF